MKEPIFFSEDTLPPKDGVYLTKDTNGVYWVNKFDVCASEWFYGMGGWRTYSEVVNGTADGGAELPLAKMIKLAEQRGEYDRRVGTFRTPWTHIPNPEPGLFDVEEE